MAIDNTTKARSWFIVYNNPEKDYPDKSPEQICDTVLDLWIEEHPTRSGAVLYCISAEGLHHLHMVLEDDNQARFSALKKVYPRAHIEVTKGTKEQAEDYIHKRGKFEEKGEQIVCTRQIGEIKGAQGQRKDWEVVQDLLDQGKTPEQIYSVNIRYRKYSQEIDAAYIYKRKMETPIVREVKVVWLFGKPETGKSHTYVDLVQKNGREKVFRVNDYRNPWDKYQGESILFLDEFRGQFRYDFLLGLLDRYQVDLPARYNNKVGLWSEVYITTPFTPDEIYGKMVETQDQTIDTCGQLLRRISEVVYCFKDMSGYHRFALTRSQYKGRDDMIARSCGNADGFISCDNLPVPEWEG